MKKIVLQKKKCTSFFETIIQFFCPCTKMVKHEQENNMSIIDNTKNKSKRIRLQKLIPLV